MIAPDKDLILADMTNETISAGYPKAFLDFAVSKGVDRVDLLERSGIRAGDLAQPDDRVPLDRFLTMIAVAAELTNEPAIALHFGETARIEDMSIVPLIGAAAETVGQALENVDRFARLVLDAGGEKIPSTRLARNEGGVWAVAVNNVYTEHRYLAEIMLAQAWCGWRRAFGEEPGGGGGTAELHVLYEEPSYRTEYDRIFGVPIVFSSKWHASRVSEDFLSIRLPTANRYVFGVLSERAEALLKGLETFKTTRGEVERQLALILHTGETGAEGVARRMKLTPKTLYRRLRAEGVTFEQVLDELRRELAISFLADQKVSVTETAYLVGFSDPAAFSRAFKRWTGSNPSSISVRK